MPEVTIGIPTRNAHATLGRVLDAVQRQKTSRSFEVLAVDWGSQDDTLSLLDTRGVRVVHFSGNAFDWGRLREVLFLEAKGHVVVNLSQDAIPASDNWLENLIKPLDDPAVGASCGTSLPDPERGYRQFQWERNGNFYFTREMTKFRSVYGKGLSFANAAVPKSIWENIHFQPLVLGEDFQFQMRLHDRGLRVAFPKDAPVFHHHQYTWSRLVYRCVNEGLALRQMGFPYTFLDLCMDLSVCCPYFRWAKDAWLGALRSPAEWFFPVLRPLSVYYGSVWARYPRWY